MGPCVRGLRMRRHLLVPVESRFQGGLDMFVYRDDFLTEKALIVLKFIDSLDELLRFGVQLRFEFLILGFEYFDSRCPLCVAFLLRRLDSRFVFFFRHELKWVREEQSV